MNVAERKTLPEQREGITHKFSINGHEGYIIVNKDNDGKPSEVFLVTSIRESTTMSGMADSLAKAISLCLQHGVPLQTIVREFSGMSFPLPF